MNTSLIAFLIITSCRGPWTKRTSKDDCLLYMNNCVYNEDIIGTYDAVRQHNLTIMDRYEDCSKWEKDQR